MELDGVAVRIVDWEFLGFSAYDHQAAVDELLTSSDSFFAVNESPTGSGKTLSWLKPALAENIDTIAVFPTNALIADQINAAQEVVDEHFAKSKIGLVHANSETIFQWRSEYDVRTKGEALARRIDESLVQNETTILFTNPDTLTIVRKGMYRHRFVSNKFDRFQMVVLDEFHLADVKQRDTLLFLIDEMYNLPERQSRTSKFYFLSATPENDTTSGRNLFTRIGEDIRETPERLSASQQPLSAVENKENWKAVMPEVHLTLRESSTFNTADKLLAEDSIEEFLQFCRGGQTVVMLDGVHEVDLVYHTLSEHFNGKVQRITGFHKGEISSKIENFDVLVSNSAVEVGLDFKPDRLVFSAHDAASLVQRLGRLRYKEQSEVLHAWCYVPSSVRAKINQRLSSHTDNSPISRTDFETAVNAAFTEECDLSSFSERWGDIEAFQHVMERADSVPGEKAREKVLEEGVERISRHYYEPYGRVCDENALKQLHRWTDHNIIEELKSYRGSGLQVMVKDCTAEVNRMKLYNVFYLLRWGDISCMSPNQFESGLTDSEADYYNAYSDYAVGYCEYYGKISTEAEYNQSYAGRSVSLRSESPALYRMKNVSDAQREPAVVDGIVPYVDSGESKPVRNLDLLREEMTKAERLCYVVPGYKKSVKSYYGLDDFFFLYQLGEDSVAIGLNALYLHCLVKDRVESTERSWGWE